MHGELKVFHQICCYFLDFGQFKLNQRMKDYLAQQLDIKFWKDILTYTLTDEANSLINEIYHDYKDNYNRSYAIIRQLVEKCEARNASVMEKLVRKVHVSFAEEFKKKILEGGW